MRSTRRPARPGGMPPPRTVTLPDGSTVELEAMAAEITEQHLARHPEDVERYGAELAREWCRHDNQHLLAWAIGDLDFEGQLSWLANVLSARGYPLASLRDNVLRAAWLVDRELPAPLGQQVAERMRGAAGRTLPTPPSGGPA